MSDQRIIKIGTWTAKPALNLLERGTQSIKIERRAMDVLVFLAEHPGEVVSVDELIAAVWKGVVVGDGSVYLAINQVRHALDEPGGETSHIETIPKRGYRLTARVSQPAPQTAAVQPGVPPKSGSIPETDRRHARTAWRLGATALAGSLLVLALAWTLRDDLRPPRAAPNSIAVLPFDNLSPDPEQEYFADGITDELTNVLAQIRDLQVTGRTSAFYFKGRNEDLRTIGTMLGVRNLLEGSVRIAGPDVRITAQLIDASTGYQVWSETYDRALHDVFAVQDEIARAVAESLQITLGVGALGRRPGMTRNVAAYDEYLRGFALHRRSHPESQPLAIDHLRRAVALDVSFGVAWAVLRTAYVNGALLVPQRAQEWQQQAAEALERARQLAPDTPDVLIQTAIDLIGRGRWLEAGAAHERAVPLFSEHGIGAEASAARGYLLLAAGRAREAVEAFESARAIDPLVPAYAVGLGNAYFATGDLQAALEEVDRGLGLDGFGPSLRRTGLAVALAADDRRQIEKRLAALSETDLAAGLVRDLALLLDEPAQAIVEIRRAAASASPAEKAILAPWSAYYGDPDLALELMAGAPPEYALATGSIWQPLLHDARELPAFKDIVRAFGLVEYWRAYGWPDFCRAANDEDFVCG